MTSGWSAVREKWDSTMEQLDKKLHQKNSFTDQLERIEAKTGVPRLRLVQAALLIMFAVVSFSLGTELISDCIGFLYPAYASIKAIESPSKEDDTRWLTYWVVYGCFVFTESLTDVFLFWFPFYWTTKCLFLIWCMLPTTSNGSDFIYNFIIRPFFLKHEKQIDSAIDQVSSNAKQYIGKVSNVLDENFIVPKQGFQAYQARESSNYHEPTQDEEYPDRTPPPFSSKLDELKNKYGDNRVNSPERSINTSRSKLFPDRPNNRSPERSMASSVDDRSSLRERGGPGGTEKDVYDKDPYSSSPVRSTARQSSRNSNFSNGGGEGSYGRPGGNRF